MKFNISWIKDFIDIKEKPKNLAHKLTMAGLEVESVETKGKDCLFEVEVTPNRADCLSMMGLAREFSAILNKPKKFPKIKNVKYPSKKISVKIEEHADCACYYGTLIEGVTVGKSNQHITSRLGGLGVKTISNIVDITNFVMFETGQPLHAFDYDKISGGKIFVRKAKKGEKLVTIDGVERDLDPSILVIADDTKVVAIAGIMGGKETEVTSSTKNILLERAHFNPVLIRRASRKLGLSSDSSYRFERGVDILNVENNGLRAINLILESAKGKIKAHGQSVKASAMRPQKRVVVTLDKINQYLGTQIKTTVFKNILFKLDFKISLVSKETFEVEPPSFRSDIKQDVDVIEEVARIIGYDNLPSSLPTVAVSTVSKSDVWITRNKIRELLISQGFNETVTFSMISQQDLDKLKATDIEAVKIINPLTQDQTHMQPTLLPGMLSITANNINKGQKNLRLFQVGKIYLKEGENDVFAFILTGSDDDWRLNKAKSYDFFDAKGVVEQTLAFLDASDVSFKTIEKEYFQKEKAVEVFSKGKSIGVIGEVSGDVLENFNIKDQKICFAQISWASLIKNNVKTKKFLPPSDYPVVVRDVSLAVKNDVSFDEIKSTILEQDTKILEGIKFIELYLGEKIPDGHRGLVFSLTYRSKERTLTEDEVSQAHTGVLDSLTGKFNVIIR